jgi:hypothetical protein
MIDFVFWILDFGLIKGRLVQSRQGGIHESAAKSKIWADSELPYEHL